MSSAWFGREFERFQMCVGTGKAALIRDTLANTA
jgi:hypothetical protein